MNDPVHLVRSVIPLWYANVAWAKELLVRAFNLEKAEDILEPHNRGCRQVPGTTWFIRTHGVGVDVYKDDNVGGVDFDFDKPDPDAWRLRCFIEKQVRDGALPHEEFKALVEDEKLMREATRSAAGEA